MPSNRARIAGLGIAAILLLGVVAGVVATLDSAPQAPVTVAGTGPGGVTAQDVGVSAPPARPDTRAPDDAPPPRDAHGAPGDRARQAFITRLRTADARQYLGEAIPLDIARLIGKGRYRDAADALLQMGRDGDLNAYAALDALLSSCPGRSGDPLFEQRADERKARNQEMIARARERGVPEHLLQRLRWSLDAANAHYRELTTEFCPAEGEGDYRALRDEARRAAPPEVPPELEEMLRKRRPRGGELDRIMEAAAPEIQARRQRLADAGLLSAQLGLATEQLFAREAARRAAGLDMLRALAPSSPQAKYELANCIRMGCAPEADDIDEARRLLLEAARAGNLHAIGALSLDAVPPRDRLNASAIDRYAWKQLYERMVAEGCYGFGSFSGWAFRQPPVSPLMGMSPPDAEAARRRAEDLVATELPPIRSAIGCDSG